MAKPTFLGIGGMRCGTTTIHDYLRQHSEVFVPEKKEVHWFHADHVIKMTQEDYENIFPSEYKVRGEISPSYYFQLETICSYYPDIKLIYAVRNPIKKFVSSMRLLRYVWPEREIYWDVDRMIETNDTYVKQGVYANAILDAMLLHMPLHIINFDDMVENQQTVWDSLCDFLEVPHYVPVCNMCFDNPDWHFKAPKPKHKKGICVSCHYFPAYVHSNSSDTILEPFELTSEQEEKLNNYYKPSNTFLREEYGITMKL